MQTYSTFRPTGFDCKGLGLPDQQDWLVLPVSQTRDSGPFDESNFAVALEMLGGESDDCEVHRFGHWGPGWFEIIIVNPSNSKLVKIAEEIESSLENYPLLDDEDHSKREHDCYLESWDYWGRSDYSKAIAKELFRQYPDGVSEDWTDDEIESAIDDFTAEEIDGLRDEAAKKVNWKYQSEGDGVTINIAGLVQSTNFDRVADMAIETCESLQKSKDIAKLAKACGANDEQAKKAVALGLVLVSQIMALINS